MNRIINAINANTRHYKFEYCANTHTKQVCEASLKPWKLYSVEICIS